MEVQMNFCYSLQAIGCIVDISAGFVHGEKLRSILQDCAKQKNLAAGRHVHSLMQKAGLVSIALYGDYLIHMFVACASLAEAEQAFLNVAQPSVYTWNAIISGHAKLGKSEKALDYYKRMLSHGNVKADKITLLCVVKSCTSIVALQEGHLTHSQIVEGGFGKDLFLGNALIDMYAKCGSCIDAQAVFDRMPEHDMVSWGAIISGYAQLGQGFPALELYQSMFAEGTEPNKVIFLSSLKACACTEHLQLGHLVHQQTVERGFDVDVMIGNVLIHMYAKCKSLEDSRNMFDFLPCKTIVSWGAMIAGYANHELGHMSLQLFQCMQEKGIQPNMVIILCILKACGAMGALDQGKVVHRQVCKTMKNNIMVENALIDMYSKCGCLREAREVFDEMLTRDVVSYDAMIACYTQHENFLLALELLSNMRQEGIIPNRSMLLQMLEGCSSLAHAYSVHYHIAVDGFDSDTVVGSALVVMYSKHECIEEAYEVFQGLSSRDVIAWGAIIAVLSEHGQGLTALKLFESMQEEHVAPTIPVFLSALKACASTSIIKAGRRLHDDITATGFETNSVVGSSLIDMYVKCGALVEAHHVFRKLQERDLVSWCSIISGYAQHQFGDYALELFGEMLLEDFEPDKGLFLSVLKACSCTKSIDQCQLIHVCVIFCGLESDVIVGSALLDLYAKCGCIEEAHKIFSILPKCFSAPWNFMMAGYIHHGDAVSALQLLQEMQQENVELEQAMILGLLKVCGCMGAIKQGRLIHDLIIGRKLEADIVFGNTLLDMYAKCGSILEAMQVFDKLPCKDVVSWGAIIAAFMQHGLFGRAIDSSRQMQASGLKPSKAIFTNILSACSHGGILEGGYACFKSMEDEHAFSPSLEHYSGMADLLSRAGQLDEAEDILQSMPMIPDLLGWTSLLTSCKTYGSVGMGTFCYEHVSQLEPSDAAAHVIMSKIYGDADTCTDVGKVNETRRNAGLWKKPGKAWMEVDGKLQEFMVGDVNHAKTRDAGVKSRKLLALMKELGYVPQAGSNFEPLAKGIGKKNIIEVYNNDLLDVKGYGLTIYSKSTCVSQHPKSFCCTFFCQQKDTSIGFIQHCL